MTQLLARGTTPAGVAVQRKDRDWVPWKEGIFGSLPRAGMLVPGTGMAIGGASVAMEVAARNKINNPIFSKCIDHYKNGHGEEMHLTAAEVENQWLNCNLFGGGFPKIKQARDDWVAQIEKRQQSQQTPEERQAGFFRPVDTSGMTLTRHIEGDKGPAQSLAFGDCTLTVTGDLTYSQRVGCSFKGTFTLFDRWDFNVEGLSTHRSAWNEIQTIAGRFLLPGEPFDVTSEPVPIDKNQQESDSVIPDRR